MSIAFQTGQIDFPGMLNTYSATDIIMARIHDFENMLHSIMELEERTGEPLFFAYQNYLLCVSILFFTEWDMFKAILISYYH